MRSFCSFPAISVVLLVSCGLSAAKAQDDSGFKYLEVTVVDPDGKPLADVAVHVKIDGMEFPMPTDEEGEISLNAPSGAKSQLQLSVKHDKFAAVSASWRGGKSFPEEFSIPLEKGMPIGGVVHDEQGEPIEGVKIEAHSHGEEQGNGKLRPLLTGHLATTDAKGRWQIQTTAEAHHHLLLKLSHEEYISDASYGQRATWEQLKSLEHVLVLKKGIELKGRVTDSEGEPLAGALVFLGSNRWESSKKATRTDAEGNYSIDNVVVGNLWVTVSIKGWAPELRIVPTKREMKAVDFQLQPGKEIRILVTDADGEPLAGVGVAVKTWRGQQTLPQELFRGKTDAEGIWQSDSMPEDEVDFSVFMQGHMSARNQKLAASEKTHTIVLPWAVVVTGKVVDAESGLPLEKFDVVQGIDWENAHQATHWERYNTKPGSNGKYRTEFTEPCAGHYVRIEADGHRPGISRVIRDDEGKVTINFEMEEGSGPSGIVKTPDGKLAVGAKLMVATREGGLFFNNGVEQMNRRKPQVEQSPGGAIGQRRLENRPFGEATPQSSMPRAVLQLLMCYLGRTR